jgi:recombinational DNA repair protein (RecF pathway)
MSYEKYITEALVCGSRAQATSNRSYLLFCREAGMIWATAQSVREERSKHRYSLQDFSIVVLSLVHGKGGWRITGTEPVHNFYYEDMSRERIGYIRNIIRTLRRFVHGEEPNQKLYDEVKAALSVSKDVDLDTLEVVASARMLNALGYIAPQKGYSEVFDAADPHEAATLCNTENKVFCMNAIEQAKTMSHL